MAAPTKKIFTVGLNAVRIYELNADGLPSATNATAYDGISVGGPVSFTYEPPDPESIAHPGNNIVLQRDTLPSLDSSSGKLEVSRSDVDTIAALTNVNVFNPATNINSIAWQTDQQGSEPTVALVAYAQAKTNDGARAWSTYVFPRCVIIPKPKSMSRDQSNLQYFVQPQNTDAHIYGVALSANNDGCTSAEVIEYQSNYRLHVAAWVTTNSEASFSFNASHKYANNAGDGIVVTKNRVLCTYSATPLTSTEFSVNADGITFGAALTNGDVVTALYEIAANAVDVD